MKLFLDWSAYQNAGMRDAYTDIPWPVISTWKRSGNQNRKRR
jgi:hypothetical protein